MINLTVITLLYSLLLTIPNINLVPTPNNLSALLLFITTVLIFYSNGIYITIIALEYLQLVDQTNPIIKLLHGPVSHVPIYSGGIVAILSIALLSLNYQDPGPFNLPFIIILGCISGSFYAHGQIYNGTYKYQLTTSAISLLIFYLFTFSHQSLPFHSPITTFFTTFCSTLTLILAAHLLHPKNHSNTLPYSI